MTMHKLVWALGLLAVGAARADEAGARAVLDKALAAHGGLDTLKKYPALTVKAKGKVYLMGSAVDFTSETNAQAPDRLRADVRGGEFKVVRILNGDKGWRVALGEAKPMGKEELAESLEELHAIAVARLVPLAGEGYKLTPLPEVTVGDQPAVGLKVEHKGRRDVSLYFDKKTGLLVKLQTRVKDVLGGGGEEVTREILYDDYKKVDGVQVPHKVTIKHDGKRALEYEVTEAKPAEKLDDALFAKP
jgi:hypothetical protein